MGPDAIQIKIETGVCHLRTGNDGHSISDLLMRADLSPLRLDITQDLIHDWFFYGCIYVDGLRTREDQSISPNNIIRVHTRRKHYYFSKEPLAERVVFQNDDFLILNKPSGLPTHATLDNWIENAAHLLSEELKIPLYVTHRLDISTRGLLILAKSKKSQAALNKQFSKRTVDKIYLARTQNRLPCGLYVHYIDPESRVPKIISDEEKLGSQECRLEILSNENDERLRIRLLTGRTHQIRAQLAFLGCPIDGDQIYGSKSRSQEGEIDLECSELGLRWMQTDLRITSSRPLSRPADSPQA